MDNLRKTNAFFGEILKDMNTEMADNEVDSFVNLTINGYIEALSILPDRIRELPLVAVMDLVLCDEDTIEEALEAIGLTDITDEELEKLDKFLQATFSEK